MAMKVYEVIAILLQCPAGDECLLDMAVDSRHGTKRAPLQNIITKAQPGKVLLFGDEEA